MKPVLAWAVVMQDGKLDVFMERYFRIAQTKKRAEYELTYSNTDSRVVRVEIREFDAPKRKARK